MVPSILFGSPTGGPRLSFANGVWIHQTLLLKPFFKHVVNYIFKASNQVDFQTKNLVGLSRKPKTSLDHWKLFEAKASNLYANMKLTELYLLSTLS
ncbi:hypothetical protein LguiB_015935 [Lonicera macranthoides]